MLAYLAVLLWVPLLAILGDAKTTDVDLLMPKVRPQKDDTYLCHTLDVSKIPLKDPSTGASYITGFKPHAKMNVAHHMLLYGCGTPGSEKSVWNCGEMSAKAATHYEQGPVCGSGAKIIYAWAMDAPALTLPKDVSFKIGDDSGIKYLVVQVHYKDVSSFKPPANKVDSSGITLHVTDVPTPMVAGVYLMVTSGVLPEHLTVYMEAACKYSDDQTIYPFAYRTHAHTHGKVISGYRVRIEGQREEWTEIGRKSPQKPQMFYNVTHPGMAVRKGDILAARCTMKNNEDREVYVGSTQHDEMCNFYIMYYVNGNKLPESEDCFTPGPPNWTWNDLNANFRSYAPRTASVDPDTGVEYKQSTDEYLAEDAAHRPFQVGNGRDYDENEELLNERKLLNRIREYLNLMDEETENAVY